MVLMSFVAQNLDVREAYTMKLKHKSSVFQFHALDPNKLAKTTQSLDFLPPKCRSKILEQRENNERIKTTPE